MGKKDKTKNKRKTFMSYYWPCLVIVFGPVVIYLVFALIYSLSTQNFFLLSPEFFGTVFLMVLYFFLFKLSTAERTVYDDTGTSVGFPLTAAMFTLHFFSPPSVEFQKQYLSSF